MQDGTKKIRPVDHLSWSCAPNRGRKRSRACAKAESINGHYTMPGEVTHDHLDDLLATMRMHFQLIGKVGGLPRSPMRSLKCLPLQAPGLVCADIDSAFRRLPLRKSHRWAAGVAYLVDGIPRVSFHYGMPFGATSSVYSWHRIGDLILKIARRILFIPMCRYVDDYFCPERWHGCATIAACTWSYDILAGLKQWSSANYYSPAWCACYLANQRSQRRSW